MAIRETVKEAGYRYVSFDKDLGGHVLGYSDPRNVEEKFELWVANKNHASYGIKFKNTDLEFACSLPYYNV